MSQGGLVGSPVPTMNPHGRRTAIILVDRPIVGADGHRVREPLPHSIEIRVTVVGLGEVTCTLDAAIVPTTRRGGGPTWGDLQAAWQDVASAIDRRIRTGDLERSGRPPRWTLRIAAADLGDLHRDPAAAPRIDAPPDGGIERPAPSR